MGASSLVSAVVSALLTAAVPVPAAPTAVRRPAYVACPVAAVPSVKPPPQPPVPPPSRDGSRPTIGGDGLNTTGLTVPAGTPALPATLSAKFWLVADLDSGAVLGACGPHEFAAPASVQKLLLAATLLPKLDPAQVVTITQEDLNFERDGSAVGFVPEGRYTVDTLWLGLLLGSGNDAANALARVGGGPQGIAGTLAAMNAEARRLGAFDTHAVTPSGLDGPGQFTSAYDLALIARACFAREDFRRYTATQRAQIPPQPPKDPRGFQIQNHNNQMLTKYPGAIGGKTGFTDIARHTFVGAAERGGRRLVVTVLGAEAQPVRASQQATNLLDWGFTVPAGANVGRLVRPGEAEPARAPAPGASSPGAGGPAGTPVRAANGWPSRSRLLTLAAVVAAVTVLLLVAYARQRTRPRRRARPAGPARARQRTDPARPNRAARPATTRRR